MNKNKILAFVIAVASLCAVSLSGCAMDNSDGEQKNSAADTVAQSSGDSSDNSDMQTQNTDSSESEPEETEQSSSEIINSETSESVNENTDNTDPNELNDIAKSAYDAVKAYAEEMDSRGTPIYENLNFSFNLYSVTDIGQDGGASIETVIMNSVKKALPLINGQVYVGTYDSANGKEIFVQYKEDNSDAVGQYPDNENLLGWGQYGTP